MVFYIEAISIAPSPSLVECVLEWSLLPATHGELQHIALRETFAYPHDVILEEETQIMLAG